MRFGGSECATIKIYPGRASWGGGAFWIVGGGVGNKTGKNLALVTKPTCVPKARIAKVGVEGGEKWELMRIKKAEPN